MLANLKSAQRMIITDPMVNQDTDIDDITKSTFFGHDAFDEDSTFWLSGLAGI